jgi:hypothetical protein
MAGCLENGHFVSPCDLLHCKNKDFEAAIMEHLVRAANLGLSLFSVLETNIKSYVFMR